MGCASSAARADEEDFAADEKQELSSSKGQVDIKSVSPSLQETAFASELSKLIQETTSGAKPKDSWVVLYKCAELICSALGLKTCSIIIYTSTGLGCKLACNAGSALSNFVVQHPDLVPAETLGFVTSVTTSQKAVCVKVGDELWDSLSVESYADFQLLTGTRGLCTALAVLPLCGGPRCRGAVLLGHTAQLAGVVKQGWLATLVPLLSLYVAESALVRNLSLIERVVDAGSMNALAYTVTSDLGDIFEWCHREDVEARLVVLGHEGDTATVYCRVPASSGAVLNDDPTSMRSGSVAISGTNLLLEEGLVGTCMLLDNTLTRRCLSGRQRLLFVADVMQALKLYGEPWKDIFFDTAVVLTPCWVLAAPLIHEGRKLGAVLWLSSYRVNSDVLMRTASTCASPIIHAVTRATALHQLYGNSTATTAGGSGVANGLALLGDSSFSKGLGGNSQHNVSSFTQLSSRHSSTVSRGRTQRAGTPGEHEDTLPGRTSVEHDAIMGDIDGGGSRVSISIPDIHVKYVLRHSPSTSALMRMYKSTIAQRAPAVDEERVPGCVHEIRIMSKAGEGAFGSVYVGRWRNIVVAVKIIKDTSAGNRSLKTAWELAVNKSLSHPSIVTVHAILTDVHLQKTSSRILRFVPAAVVEAQQAAAAASTLAASGNSIGSPSVSGGGAVAAATATAADGIALLSGTPFSGSAATPLRMLPGTPSCPLPSAPSAVAASNSGGGSGGGGGMLSCATRGGSQSYCEPSTPPSFARTSVGSNVGGPPLAAAALLKPSKPLAPKVHAILMEYCNLGGLHKFIDNRMFFRDRMTLHDSKGSTESSRVLPTSLPPESLHMDFILATMSEIASALQYLHSQGFVHCDLKPENVMLKEANNRRGFTAKLADFGLSELRSADGQVVGDLGGTVTHVAPESVLHRQISSASDMYAFGILMWELYTGQQPYRELLSHISKREDRHKALLARVVHEGLRPSFPPGVPQDYWSLAVQCWSADPTARPTTGEVLQALETMYSKYGPGPQQGPLQPHQQQLPGVDPDTLITQA